MMPFYLKNDKNGFNYTNMFAHRINNVHIHQESASPHIIKRHSKKAKKKAAVKRPERAELQEFPAPLLSSLQLIIHLYRSKARRRLLSLAYSGQADKYNIPSGDDLLHRCMTRDLRALSFTRPLEV